MSCQNPAVSQLAGAIIHRIENPRGDKNSTFKMSKNATFGKRHVGKTAYRSGMVRIRSLTLEDKQDILQTVQVMACTTPETTCQFRAKFDKGELDVFPIFRAVRDMLKMNGGNHDRALCDSLDLLCEQGRDFSMPHKSQEEQAIPQAIAEEMETMLAASFAADTSRERKAKFARMAGLVAAFAGIETETVFASPEAKRKAAFDLRAYLSIPCKGALQRERDELATDLMQSMQTAKPAETMKETFQRVRAMASDELDNGWKSDLPVKREIIEIALSPAKIGMQWNCENGNHGLEIL